MSDEDTESDLKPEEVNRSICVHAYGDTADELELNALTMAREAFGPYRLLTPVLRYHIYPISESDGLMHRQAGKKFRSNITIWAVDPEK